MNTQKTSSQNIFLKIHNNIKSKKGSEPKQRVLTLVKCLSHQAVRTGWETTKKAGTEVKTNSISNKELNAT